MKIAFIGQKGLPDIPGGVETHVEHLATSIVASGHEVLAYTREHYYASNPPKEYKGVELVCLPHIYTKYLDAVTHTFLACLHVWWRKDVDIIHFQSIGPSLFIPLMRVLRPRTPIIATVHSQCYHHSKWGIFARRILHIGEWMVCNTSDKVIAISQTLTEYLHMRHRCHAQYIPNGINTVSKHGITTIKKYGLTDNSYIFTVGRMMQTKRIHDLITAFKKTSTDKKLVIAWASTHDEDYEKKIIALAATDSRIIMIHKSKQTPKLMSELFSHAALFVLPSDVEGLSIALLEAMSYSRATLVSDIVENTDVISDTGESFPVGDTDALAKKLESMINNEKKLEKLGKLAQKRAYKLFHWKSVTEKTIKLYSKTLQKKGNYILKQRKVSTVC